MPLTLAAPVHSELIIKKSRFIGCVQPMADRAGALKVVEALRERGENRITPRAAVTQEHVWFARPSGIVGFDRTGTRTALPLEV